MSDRIDMSRFVEAKSDQLNADDLIGITKTITITKVTGSDGDQPIAIHYEGDRGKPFKPCKTIRRVLLAIWGRYANDYVGKSMTLYRDDKVTFGGLDVGGIRISHMSGIEKETVVVVMKSKGKKAGMKILPLVVEKSAPKVDRPAEGVRALIERIHAGEDVAVEPAVIKQRAWLAANRPELSDELEQALGATLRADDPFAEGPADSQRGDGFDVSADEIIAFIATKARQEDVISLVASHAPAIMNMTEEDRDRIVEAQTARIAEIKGDVA